MQKHQRNLNPHRTAVCAMWLYGTRYNSQSGGSMDLWDKLTKMEKNVCRIMANQISQTRPESDNEKETQNP